MHKTRANLIYDMVLAQYLVTYQPRLIRRQASSALIAHDSSTCPVVECLLFAKTDCASVYVAGRHLSVRFEWKRFLLKVTANTQTRVQHFR